MGEFSTEKSFMEELFGEEAITAEGFSTEEAITAEDFKGDISAEEPMVEESSAEESIMDDISTEEPMAEESSTSDFDEEEDPWDAFFMEEESSTSDFDEEEDPLDDLLMKEEPFAFDFDEEENTNIQKMKAYIQKCDLLGKKNFDFDFDEIYDIVAISRIYAKKGENIIVPKFVSEIWSSAWSSVNMEPCNIFIPKECTINLECTFDSFANHVINIEIEKGHEDYAAKDGVLFNKEKTELLVYPSYKENDRYTVPSSVVKILDRAFGKNEKLKKLNISANVVEIGNMRLTENTFISVSEQNISYKGIRGSLYSKNGIILHHIFVPKDKIIIIEEGTVLVKNINLTGRYKALVLPHSIKPAGDFYSLIETMFDLIRAPKELRKYLKEYDDILGIQVMNIKYE